MLLFEKIFTVIPNTYLATGAGPPVYEPIHLYYTGSSILLEQADSTISVETATCTWESAELIIKQVT